MSSNCSNVTSASDSGNLPIFQLIPIQRFNRTICCVLGIPLNILVVTVILRSRQLWSARNIFWLAVTFFNLLALTQSLTELSIFYLRRRADGSHQTLCAVYSTLLGYPYALLLTGLTLASWDRYLALAHHDFYRNNATQKNVIILLTIVFVTITAGQFSPYWLGILTIKCDLKLGWIAVSICFQGILSLACLFVQVKLFVFVRACIRYSPSVRNEIDLDLIAHPVSDISLVMNRVENFTLKCQQRNVNRLELRATRILGMGVLPFCFVTLTLSVSSVMLIVFRLQGLEGFWLRVVMVTSRELLLTHLVYTPAVFVVQSREFHAAFKRFFRRHKRVGEFC